MHISFVRSISMDAFKQTEIERMRHGGNNNWKAFFDAHEDSQMRDLSWDDATIAERYSGEVGEEWKERLSAKVEGREYVPGERKPSAAAKSSAAVAVSPAARSESPGAAASGKAKVDDKYFESLGAANASRPEDLPPNQGGKYAGFGSTPIPQKQEGLPKFEDLQKDPLAALTKSFGWFSTTVTKTAANVNKDFIQPTTKQVCDIPQGWTEVPESNMLANYRSESQISQLKQKAGAASLHRRLSREHGAQRRTLTSSSRAPTAATRPVQGTRRLTRARSLSGTISRRPRTNESRRAIRLGRLLWAREHLAAVVLVRLRRGARRARMSGMIGECKQASEKRHEGVSVGRIGSLLA